MGGQSAGGSWTPTKRRGPIAAEFSSPGPASIGLASTFGTGVTTKARSPAFTISGRHENKLDTAGPGPGHYNINGLSHKAGRDEPHAPSMHIRPKDPKQYVTPAPGDYCPEKSHKRVLDASPKFSFGIKADSGKNSDAPAPNSYTIPSLMCSAKIGLHMSAPSFTMSSRPRDEEDKMKVPGPGSYNEATVDKYKTLKSPAFSMGQRTNIPSDQTRKPGPGAHRPEKCLKNTGPKYTMCGRPASHKDKMQVPGPGSYDEVDISVCKQKLPAFTIAHRIKQPSSKVVSPSPNAYCPENCMNDRGPKFTMAPRPKDDEDKMKIPGPGTYDVIDINTCREQLPVYSMGIKTEIITDKFKKPSPFAYSPEKCMNDRGPKFTMAPRPKDDEDKMKIPGPGTYDVIDINTCREQLPVYSMGIKTEIITDKSKKPSPFAYSPEKAQSKNTPEFSFGVKHSNYLGKLRDQ